MNTNSSDSGVPIRVFFFDAHKIILWGLERLIESATPTMHCVGSTAIRAGFIGLVVAAAADVVVFDVDQVDDDPAQLVSDLVHETAARVLILTGNRNQDFLQKLLVKGASGVVQTQDSPETLLRAIGKVADGEIWLHRTMVGRVFDALAGGRGARDLDSDKIGSLTPRERKIIAVTMENKGARNKIIADRLHISEHTLRNHLAAIYRKLGINGRIELFLYAANHDLDAPVS